MPAAHHCPLDRGYGYSRNAERSGTSPADYASPRSSTRERSTHGDCLGDTSLVSAVNTWCCMRNTTMRNTHHVKPEPKHGPLR
jgi:hypothetical protein